MSAYKHSLGMAGGVLRDVRDAYVIPTAKLWPQAHVKVQL